MLTIYKKSKINDIKKLSKLVGPFKEDWVNTKNTNCYAYALGLDVSIYDLDIEEFSPGFTFGEIPKCYSKESLLEYIVKDLDNLKIDFRFVNDYYKLGGNEWKVAIFGGQEYSCDSFDDFHFLRQTIDGIWTHKTGYYDEPTNMDSKKKVIESPILCNLDSDNVNYKYIKTLCLRRF